LQRIAPVTAVRGNNDKGEWASPLPATAIVDICGQRLYIVHDIADLDVDPVADGFAAVIAGHSHKPAVTQKDGVLFLNPGSAGPRRFTLPIAVARMFVGEGAVRAEICPLRIAPPAARAQ
jgi:predicted phosphodiesterase